MRRTRSVAYVAAMLVTAAISCNIGGTRTLDGILSHERDSIEYGTSSSDLRALSAGDNVTFHSGDSVHVFNGGEGQLDFGDDMVLRLFNDTSLNVVSIVADSGSPRDVQMRLEDGGFTGTYHASGGSLTVRTPGGTAVLVRGTEFFVIYSPGSQVTLAGNFNGAVELDWGSGPTSLTPGYFREILPSGPTGPEQPIPLTRQDFENETRQNGSMLRVTELIMQGAYGEPDVIEEPPPPQEPDVEPAPTPNEVVQTEPPAPGETPITCYVGFNLDTYPFYDQQIRKALSWAIDREALVQTINPDAWQPAYSMVPPGVWPDGGYYPTGINYDPDYAQSLMFEAGYEAFALTLTFYEPYSDQAEFVANSWAEALDPVIDFNPIPDFQEFQNILADGPPPVYLVCWAANEYSPYDFLIEAPGQYYDSAALSDVLPPAEEAYSSGDIGQQIELYHQADVTLVEDAALVIPLYHTVQGQ